HRAGRRGTGLRRGRGPHEPCLRRPHVRRDTGVTLGLAFYPWVFVMVAASSNGVNLTDGLDGLASGTTALVLAAFRVIAVREFRHACGSVGAGPACYRIDPAQALDDAIVAAG